MTKLVARGLGSLSSLYLIAEYPKSGGTWTAKMVGNYLNIPFPQFSVAPVVRRAVVLSHWRFHPRYRNVFYVYRDGRDVMTSFFFHRLRVANDAGHPNHYRTRDYMRTTFGTDFAERHMEWLFPRFIDRELREPGPASPLSWADHLKEWYAPEERPHIAYLRYEDLLERPAAALSDALECITGTPVDSNRLIATIEKFSMENLTGRNRGEEDRGHHVRKGVAGDWINHFSRECAEIFHRHAGDTLIALGYETSSDWVDRRFHERREQAERTVDPSID